jgi:hypothetical protein
VETERRSEALAVQRAEAESRATASLQARITAEEALAREAAEAAHAHRVADEAAQGRAGHARHLRALLRAKGSGLRIWMLAAAALVLAGSLATYYHVPVKAPEAQTQTGDPLKLRLDYRLR